VTNGAPTLKVLVYSDDAAVRSSVKVSLDGEATPSGGMGLCRQLKDEIYNCPPVLVLVGRVDDRWLATWSQADAVVAHPIDPRAVVTACLELLKTRNPISQ
jgi:DNA-binding response OmpR family regulator